ncbi:hypothetical protein D3C85_1065150 [compost metagenome]
MWDPTARQQLSPLLQRAAYHAQHQVALSGRDHRPHLRSLGQSIAQADTPDPVCKSFDEGIVDVVFHQQTRTCRADLACVEVDGVERLVQRHFEVGIGEDDIGVLAPQLQRHPFEVAAGRTHHLATSGCAAGQGH